MTLPTLTYIKSSATASVDSVGESFSSSLSSSASSIVSNFRGEVKKVDTSNLARKSINRKLSIQRVASAAATPLLYSDSFFKANALIVLDKKDEVRSERNSRVDGRRGNMLMQNDVVNLFTGEAAVAGAGGRPITEFVPK